MDNAPNPNVDAFMQRAERWRAEFDALRALLRQAPLDEDLKWGQPCYTLGKANVVLMHGFKDYCALLFMKGALMPDPQGLLIQQTENVQSARQIRFTCLDQITDKAATLKAYIDAAITVERAGLKVDFKKTEAFAMPDEFRARLDGDRALKEAFVRLTPGRQRAYLLHFSSAKQSKTREARIEKCLPQIMDGLGLDD
ncbi:YdeI/OmpD-associated family protein [Asticcacaulis excentricus]|uniref:YdhG-like domain-containing protein n=1 Tax=Asticcacaulis excentricus (strain ATCC 15261 / DSM 4724 / KCTC 12464 / NCIMB 9791 / VKM B-1370 / CB 48) TaxID=573065 RepID=E8RP76_ASTEC|nr:DUF1801 domain-containing protein [Asticcacaulis excentricus]ADU11922.1 Domain of unknown function DUF1801 [Asticcacaulis excentricus CB 48]